MYKKKKEKKSLVCIYMYAFELIMQKKTVRLYFIQNIHDNDDLIVHVHHGRSQLGHNYVRLEQQALSITLARKDNWLEQIRGRGNREEHRRKYKDTNVARGRKSNCY